jgi:excisionase family DNA binding protein
MSYPSLATTTDDRELVTVQEAGRLASLSRTSLYNLIRGGRLASVKIGRRRLIPRRAITQLAAEATGR